MSANRQAAVAPISVNPSLFAASHTGVPEEVCPLCDQAIPLEKLVEIQQRERQRAALQEQQLRTQFEQERAALLTLKDSEIDRLREASVTDLAKAKQEAAEREIDARNTAKKETEAAMLDKVKQALEAKTAAEARANTITAERETLLAQKNAELDQVRKNAASSVEQIRQEGLTRETEARNVGKREAEAVLEEKIAAAVQSQTAAETLLKQLQNEHATLIARNTEELDQVRKNAASKIAQAEQAAVQRETEARIAATKQVQEAMNEKLTAAIQAQTSAEARLKTIEETRAEQLQTALAEQRTVLEQDKTLAIQKEKSKAFEDRQKLEGKLEDMQRQLKKERADELGEAAELNLETTLRSEFPSDEFRRIDKGVAGADLWQDVVHNKKICGRIVYDSKNRNAWRNDYVDKLKTDQIDAEGAYSILATRVFPAGTKQLHVQDGVFVCHPARILALTGILREQLVRIHKLQLSAQERTAKTSALYDFMTSERCHQIFVQFQTLSNELLELDVAEKKQHETTWRKRGEMLKKAERSILIQLQGEIDRITGDAALEQS